MNKRHQSEFIWFISKIKIIYNDYWKGKAFFRLDNQFITLKCRDDDNFHGVHDVILFKGIFKLFILVKSVNT